MYDVKIQNKVGSLDSTLFDKMAKNGDISPTKITEIIGEVVNIKGYAECVIITADKEFTMYYYDTEEFGIISSGSEIFYESVICYYGQVDKVRISSIKTKKGSTYKAVPELGTKSKEQGTNDELPF